MTAQPIGPLVPRSELYKALARIDELELQLAEANERLAELSGTSTAKLILQVLPVSRSEATFLAVLYEAAPHVVPDQTLYDAGAGFRERTADNPPNVVKTRACLLRAKLKRLYAPPLINTVWGVGYAMPTDGKEWLRKRLSEPREQNANEALTTAPNTRTHGDVDNASEAAPCAGKIGLATTSGSR